MEQRTGEYFMNDSECQFYQTVSYNSTLELMELSNEAGISIMGIVSRNRNNYLSTYMDQRRPRRRLVDIVTLLPPSHIATLFSGSQ